MSSVQNQLFPGKNDGREREIKQVHLPRWLVGKERASAVRMLVCLGGEVLERGVRVQSHVSLSLLAGTEL